MDFPAPVISVAIEPKTKADQEKLGVAIQSLAEEDPTFHVKSDEETGQTIISGMGELHLEILVDRMKREFKVEANVGKPQVAYRETLRKTVSRYDYTHKKQSGGSGQFAKIQISVEPLPTGSENPYEFVNKITGGRIPKEYIPSVDDGCQEALASGPLAGYPLVDVKVTLLDGAYHDVDSSDLLIFLFPSFKLIILATSFVIIGSGNVKKSLQLKSLLNLFPSLCFTNLYPSGLGTNNSATILCT